jgi:hypothetical protein
MKMASLLSQPTKLNRSLQLLFTFFVENSLCSLKNIPSGFNIYIVRTIYYFFFISNSYSLVVLNLKASRIGSSTL